MYHTTQRMNYCTQGAKLYNNRVMTLGRHSIDLDPLVYLCESEIATKSSVTNQDRVETTLLLDPPRKHFHTKDCNYFLTHMYTYIASDYREIDGRCPTVPLLARNLLGRQADPGTTVAGVVYLKCLTNRRMAAKN